MLVNQIEQIARLLRRFGLPLGVTLAVGGGVLLPLNLLVLQPLHHDEALYATWALKIATGQDPWLSQTPIDKPPLFLYTVAGSINLLGVSTAAARLPSLVATGLNILLTFWLGYKLYNSGVGLLAAWLVALSPFTLAFAPTAFTDPMLVTLILAGCVAAAHGRAFTAGLGSGLAVAVKQQGVFFAPLVAGLLIVGACQQFREDHKNPTAPRPNSASVSGGVRGYFQCRSPGLWWRFTAALLLALLPAFLWDAARSQPSGFWQQSLTNYGGLTTDFGGFAERWQGFSALLFYGTASPILNTVFVIGLPLLLLISGWQLLRQPTGPALPDWLLALFVLAFVLLHALFSFQVWDRYLLGLMPLLALLLARILLLPAAILEFRFSTQAPRSAAFSLPRLWGGIIALLLALSLAGPVRDTVQARYPLGSNSSALTGIDQIVAYLQGHAGADTTLYHRWLGAHWRFYLWDYPYDLQFWESPEAVAATARPGHLIALPAWQSDTTLRLALHQHGLRLHELIRVYSPAGAPTIILHRFEPLSNPVSE